MAVITKPHTASAFDIDLTWIDRGLESVGFNIGRAIPMACKALVERDSNAAARAICEAEAAIAMCQQIENMTVLTIARRQPMAVDLRIIVGASKTARNFLRIAGLIRDVAERAASGGTRTPEFSKSFTCLSQLVRSHFHDTLATYVSGDVEGAIASLERGTQVNQQHASMSAYLHSYIQQDPNNVAAGIAFLFCSAALCELSEQISEVARTSYYIAEGRPLANRRMSDGEHLMVVR